MKKLIRFLTFWIPVKKWRKGCRNLLSQLTLEYLTVFIRLIGKNNVGVLSCDGMGDYIYLLGYMDEFKKTHKIKKLIFLARSNHQKFLAEKVSAFDGVILVSSSFLTLVKSQYSYNYEKFLMGNFFQPIIYQNINDKTCCALDGLKYLLNLGKDAQLNLDIYKYENFDKKLNKLGANIQIEEGE